MSRPDKKQRERARRQRRAERRAEASRDLPFGQPEAQDAAEPIRGVRAPLIDEGRRWHLIRTAPHLGRLGRQSLDEALKKRDVTAFRPRASEVVVRRGRRVVRRVPLVLKTLIVGVRDAPHLDEVAALPGVAEIVAHPEVDESAGGNVPGTVLKPARLEPKALQRFMAALASGEIVQPVGLKVEDAVVVMQGPFRSFPGVVEAILPGDRIKVGVSIFGRSSPVECGIADVQAV